MAKSIDFKPSGVDADMKILATTEDPSTVAWPEFGSNIGEIDKAKLDTALDTFGSMKLAKTSVKGVAGLTKVVFDNTQMAWPPTTEEHLKQCFIDAVYNANNEEGCLVPCMIINFSAMPMLDIPYLAIFREASEGKAPAGETSAAGAQRKFTDGCHIFRQFLKLKVFAAESESISSDADY